MRNYEIEIHKAANALAESDALLVTAGAGMGVDSGLPDFRGTEGFWRAYPVAERLGLRFEELADPIWFERDPALAWAFYGHRLHLYRDTVPHYGFELLKGWGATKPYGMFVFTSNVDGQFQKAGYDTNTIVEVHGSIHHLQCTRNCSGAIWSAKETSVEIDDEFRAKEPLPRCIRCEALARPNILMFGDWSWEASRTEAQKIRFSAWIERLRRAKAKLCIIEIGAGKSVPTVRRMSEAITNDLNGTLIRINPRESDGAHIALPMGALEALRRIEEMIDER